MQPFEYKTALTFVIDEIFETVGTFEIYLTNLNMWNVDNTMIETIMIDF